MSKSRIMALTALIAFSFSMTGVGGALAGETIQAKGRTVTHITKAEAIEDWVWAPAYDRYAMGTMERRKRGISALGATLQHLCRHLASHVNVWDFGRLIWVADVISLAEQFVSEIDWERVRHQCPAVLDMLSLFHSMTPLSDELLSRASIKIGRAPEGIGVEYQGWPRPERERQRGWRRVLRDTLFPSEWWLRLRYKLGSTRPLFWYRWVRHPLYILGHVARAILERLGWPAHSELVSKRTTE